MLQKFLITVALVTGIIVCYGEFVILPSRAGTMGHEAQVTYSAAISMGLTFGLLYGAAIPLSAVIDKMLYGKQGAFFFYVFGVFVGLVLGLTVLSIIHGEQLLPMLLYAGVEITVLCFYYKLALVIHRSSKS